MNAEDFIKEHYQTMKVSEIAKKLGMKEGSVKHIARKLGIRKFRSRPWTEDDICFLVEHFPDKKGKWCADRLGRGFHAVHKKAEQLGLKPNWTYIYEDLQGYLVDTTDRENKRYVHRMVMEQKLGRPLETWEIIHHIDGNKKNNHPDNLEITTRSEHINMHRDDLNRGKSKI